MTDATPNSPKILIGASIPRSGHHFLQGMLTAYFARDMFYCEYYSLPNCCRSVPCTRRGAHKFIYQKSHDRDFSLPADVSDALYLVQYRHPVPEALSDRELELRDGLGRINLNFRLTREGYINWLAGKAIYYRKFHDKWMARRIPNAIYLDYADLTARSADLLRAIIMRTSGSVDERRLDDVVEQAKASRVSAPRKNGQTESFKPRVIADSPFFDAELLGAFEAWVIERCPSYDFRRELSGSYEDSALYGMILLKDLDEPLPPGETKRFKAAARIAPDHPEILRRAALKSLRDGHVAKAIASLEKLVTRYPFFAAGYSLLFSACADSGTPVPDSVLNGNALVACSESADLLIEVGSAFQQKGFGVNAVAAYALATSLAPDNQNARERLAAAVSSAKR